MSSRSRSRALTLLLLAAACVHRPRPTEHLLPGFTPMGHRGAAGLAPENTMAAFRRADALGVGFELDTSFSGSGELIVVHEDELTRLTGAPGSASKLSLAALRERDFGGHFGPSFAGEKIPLLDEVLTAFGGRRVINIEVKSERGSDNKRLADAVADLLEARGLVDRVIVSSFSPFLLEALRARNPRIARGQIYGTFKDADLKWIEKALLRNLAFNRRAVPDVLAVEHVLATPKYVRRMHRRGYKVLVWTVNDPAVMGRLIDAGVDGIITDYPDRLIEVMRARGMPVPL
ncbi:MAG: glycerophosphodiester phosphodiesterase family protein [Nannocystaceae bacterium]